MITAHAHTRMQQRAIGSELLDLMDMVAMEGFQKGGSLIQQIPRQELSQLIKKTKKLLKALNNADSVYCVRSSNNQVITTGHKTRIIKTNY
ncbi:hypothetical protein [Endozoicomonas atrinae]|uniref:hypothetical protein n=1 Tax=Endozoicomonas atrinae TaxID=1333660 RepID=UPI000AED0CA0|nr:hypothetical protein [Endozoicomonas atrinae]